MKDHNENELIKQCIKGKARYQRKLYDKYSPKVYAVCYRYAKNGDDAQDILQETFIRVFNSLKSFKGDGSFEGWIRRIAVNCSIRHYEKAIKKIDRTTIDPDMDFGNSEDILSSINADEIINLINQLPDGFRVVFNMYAIEGYSHKEIGEALGITDSSSRSQLTRARKLLMEQVTALQAKTVA